MVDEEALNDWFCCEVLPLERALTQFIRRNWRVEDDVTDLRHDVYEMAFSGARGGLPLNTRHYIFAVARNHLINRAKRTRIVSFDLVADLDELDRDVDFLEAERHLSARETLRRVQEGMAKLSPRVREIIQLRKIEGLTVQETSEQLGIGKDAVNHQVMMGMRALADHLLGGSGKVVRPKFARRHRRGHGS